MWIGIDPGKSGAIAVLSAIGLLWQKLDATEADVSDFLNAHAVEAKFALIEKVSASPQMGVCSAFTFGRSFGFFDWHIDRASRPVRFRDAATLAEGARVFERRR